MRIFRFFAWVHPLLLASTLLAACNNTSSKSFVRINYDENDGVITITPEGKRTWKYTISTASQQLASDTFSSIKSLNILNLLKKKKDVAKEMSLAAVKNNGALDIHLSIENLKDTTFSFIVPQTTYEVRKTSILGNCAPLSNASASTSDESNLRKWLYRSKSYLPDSLVARMTAIYRTLTKSDKDAYKPMSAIPVLKSLDGITFRIISDMKADYYALVACNKQSFIDSYVEQLIGANFAGAATSLAHPLSCKHKNGESGYFALVLLGINKDWTYQQLPVGLVAQDNTIEQHSEDIVSIQLNGNTIINLPSNKPKIFGEAGLQITNSQGNGIACNVTFRAIYSGDIKSITVKRTRDLCYHSSILGYDEETPGPKNFVILTAKETSPHTFTVKLHLEDGDNHIPYIIEDYHGNRKEGKIIHRASFTRRNAPEINIDNDIDIYN